MNGRHRKRSRHKRPVIVASFAVLLVVTTVAFAATAGGYFATEKVKGDIVSGAVTDYRVDETADPAEIVVEVEIENPTRRPMTVDSAKVNGVVNGTTVARGSTAVDETIPAGGSETITVRMRSIVDDHSAVIEAAENGSMRFDGSMWARIERLRFEVNIPPSGGGEHS